MSWGCLDLPPNSYSKMLYIRISICLCSIYIHPSRSLIHTIPSTCLHPRDLWKWNSQGSISRSFQKDFQEKYSKWQPMMKWVMHKPHHPNFKSQVASWLKLYIIFLSYITSSRYIILGKYSDSQPCILFYLFLRMSRITFWRNTEWSPTSGQHFGSLVSPQTLTSLADTGVRILLDIVVKNNALNALNALNVLSALKMRPVQSFDNSVFRRNVC